MNTPRLNYVVVGLFVTASLAGVIVALALLTGRTGPTDAYHVVFRNVTGVKFGTQVVYEGFPIGQVESVTPQPEEAGMRFRIDVSVTSGWRIPEDSVATIAAPGLLAAVTVRVQAGNSATVLEPGGRIPSREPTDLFGAVSSLAGEISELSEEDIKPLLQTIKQTFLTATDILDGDGRELIGELTVLAGSFADRAPKIIDNVDAAAVSLKQTAGELSLLASPENREQIEALIANLNRAAEDFTKLSSTLGEVSTRLDRLMARNDGAIDDALADMRYVMRTLARDVDSITQNMEGTARNMFEFSRQIRQNPGLLLGGSPPPEAAGAAR